MSEYVKSCVYCKAEIKMSDKKDKKWLPYNLDGSLHECKKENGHENKQQQQQEGGEEMIPVPKSMLLQLIKFIEGSKK